jgi:hypothetical protein
MGAIEKMQESVRRDRQELDFQTKKVASSGQLEAQTRQAKIKIIEERLHSKEEKLKEMTDTQADLERKMQQQADRDAKHQLVEDAKRAPEQKNRESMAVAAHAREEYAEKLEKAAEAIQRPHNSLQAEDSAAHAAYTMAKAVNTPAVYELFLQEHPHSRHAADARSHIEKMKNPETPEPSNPLESDEPAALPEKKRRRRYDLVKLC